MSKQPDISVIIPAYRESARLPMTLAKIRSFLAEFGADENLDYEVIVVDDGSPDDMESAIHRYVHDWPMFRYVRHEKNQGKGAAVRTGMLEAKGAWRLFTDADNATPIAEFDLLWDEREDAEIVIGSRYLPSSTIKRAQPWYRRMLSRLGNQVLQRRLTPGIVDTQCGFKLFRGDVADELFGQLQTTGWLFDVELLARARKAGYRVKEVPVEWFNDADSRFRSVAGIRRALRELKALEKMLQ